MINIFICFVYLVEKILSKYVCVDWPQRRETAQIAEFGESAKSKQKTQKYSKM